MADGNGLDTPNCPTDLVPMEVGGTDKRPYWVCPACGVVSVAG